LQCSAEEKIRNPAVNSGSKLANIFVYLVRLADQLDIDLPEAVDRKIALNEAKYTADLVRGSAKKLQ